MDTRGGVDTATEVEGERAWLPDGEVEPGREAKPLRLGDTEIEVTEGVTPGDTETVRVAERVAEGVLEGVNEGVTEGVGDTAVHMEGVSHWSTCASLYCPFSMRTAYLASVKPPPAWLCSWDSSIVRHASPSSAWQAGIMVGS